MLSRLLETKIQTLLPSGKVILLIGARQTGKTTLIRSLMKKHEHSLYLNGDDPQVIRILESATESQLGLLTANYSLICIDEAQQIPNIGRTLKLLADGFPKLNIIATGSSALELSDRLNEPLTGRKWELTMFPVSWKELEDSYGFLESTKQLEQRLLFGMYPEIISSPGSEIPLLQQLAGSYLYKDILIYGGIRKPDVLSKLLQALAWQIGQEVSYNELSRTVGVDKATIINYLDLLEKAWVIFRLNPLSRNLRTEISSSRKVYFWDTGIRNALISNFQPVSLRTDLGPLWENFVISERIKALKNNQNHFNSWFWRTQNQQEIDYVEDRDGLVFPFEMKWNPNTKSKNKKTFIEAYQAAQMITITPDSFRDFLIF